MPLIIADRVKETTTATGTGTVTLLGASTGFQSFAVIGNANTTYYTIAGQTGSQWEVGIGTYTVSGTTLARNTVLSSSNSGSLVNFSAGTKDVFVTYPAGKSVNLNESNNSSALGTPTTFIGTNITGTATSFTASNVTTNANLTGAVTSVGNAASLGSFTSAQLATALTDETGTGANVFATSPVLVTPALGTPSSGVVTNLTGTASININGTVGATTAAAGSFTTVSASGNLKIGANAAGNTGTAELRAPVGSPISSQLLYGTDGAGWQFAIGKNQGGTVTQQVLVLDSAVANTLVVNNTGLAVTGRVNSFAASPQWAPDFPDGLSLSGNASGGFLSSYADDSVLQIGAGIGQKTGVVMYAQSAAGGSRVAIRSGGSEGATFSSTGLAVTGTVTSTTDATLSGVRVGKGAGAIASNTALGSLALNANTTGSDNTASGVSALRDNTTGTNNTANGLNALILNTTGSNNTASGRSALALNTTGIENTANGRSALQSNTTGVQNTASGVNALVLNTTGSFNTASGVSALENNTTGYNNTASGLQSLRDNTTGYENTATGRNALQQNTTGIHNIASGGDSLPFNTTGSRNTASGFSALLNNTTGNNNTAIGNGTGNGITTGSGNTILGANVTGLAAGLTNNIILADGTGTIRGRWDGTSWVFQGGGGATGGGGDAVFVENSRIVTTSYTLSAGKNASAVGPLTINNGVQVTVPTGARLVVL